MDPFVNWTKNYRARLGGQIKDLLLSETKQLDIFTDGIIPEDKFLRERIKGKARMAIQKYEQEVRKKFATKTSFDGQLWVKRIL